MQSRNWKIRIKKAISDSKFSQDTAGQAGNVRQTGQGKVHQAFLPVGRIRIAHRAKKSGNKLQE